MVVVEAVRDTMQYYTTEAKTIEFKSEMKTDFQVLKHEIELLDKNVDNKIGSLENRLQKDISVIRTQMAVIMWTQGLIVLTVVVPAIKQMLGL